MLGRSLIAAALIVLDRGLGCKHLTDDGWSISPRLSCRCHVGLHYPARLGDSRESLRFDIERMSGSLSVCVSRWCHSLLHFAGYEFPWSVWSLFEWQGGASYHDFHHSHNTGNFGGASSKFWDQLMGTDRTYHEYMARISANPALATDIPVDATDPGRAADETPEMRAKSD